MFTGSLPNFKQLYIPNLLFPPKISLSCIQCVTGQISLEHHIFFFLGGGGTLRLKCKIQETFFNVDFQMYNIIRLAMGYFVDKHDMQIWCYQADIHGNGMVGM